MLTVAWNGVSATPWVPVTTLVLVNTGKAVPIVKTSDCVPAVPQLEAVIVEVNVPLVLTLGLEIRPVAGLICRFPGSPRAE